MNIKLVEIPDVSGHKCQVLSAIVDEQDESLFEEFLNEYSEQYPQEIEDIYNRLKFIGNEGGAREQFFKQNEGAPGDLVCALYDQPDSNLRLYCIRFGSIAVILGGGGYKSKSIRSWQEDPKLSANAEMMKRISQIIYNAIKEKDIIHENNRLVGNMELTDLDYGN